PPPPLAAFPPPAVPRPAPGGSLSRPRPRPGRSLPRPRPAGGGPRPTTTGPRAGASVSAGIVGYVTDAAATPGQLRHGFPT
ncbi:hypothetical protein ACN6LM_000151, partial [Streptomyces sp. SAS_281]